MATGHGSMSFDETNSVQKSLEISPSANANSSPIYSGGKGKKKSSAKAEAPAKADKMPGKGK